MSHTFWYAAYLFISAVYGFTLAELGMTWKTRRYWIMTTLLVAASLASFGLGGGFKK